MISMNSLGTNGRLGNQLFQYGFLFGLSNAKAFSFCLPPNYSYYKSVECYKTSSSIFDCFDLKCIIKETHFKIKNEEYYDFDPSFPLTYSDNTDYRGYYQSYKYFDKYKNKLLDSLKFKQVHIDACDKTLNYDEIVSIHVRRGDYIGNSFHGVVDLDYINNAKKLFYNKKFLVFSDDIEWCRQNNLGNFYAKNNLDCVDLYQMSLCSASIIANSSFSWWGAYLGRQKEKVIAPKNWFSGNSGLKAKDIYCEGWIVL